MAFVPCDHLSTSIVNCASGPAPGTPCVCICKNEAGDAVRPRIRNVHSAAHGQLTKQTGSPPPGVDAVYDFEHDTTTTQSPGTTVDGAWIPYSGGTIKIRIRFRGDSGPEQFDLETNDPGEC